jgi:hypothetical protein
MFFQEKTPYYNRNYQSITLIDKFNYLSLTILKDFTEAKNNLLNAKNNLLDAKKNLTLTNLGSEKIKNNTEGKILEMEILLQQKNIMQLIEDTIIAMEIMPNTGYYHTVQYLFSIFIDNRVNVIFPYDMAQEWSKNSIEKTLFQTVTGEYIVKNQVAKLIESNKETPEFLLYAYLITINSFSQSPQNFITEKKWLVKNIQRSSLSQAVVIKRNNINNFNNGKKSYIQKQSKIIYYFLVILGLMTVIFLSKQIYWNNIKSILQI